MSGERFTEELVLSELGLKLGKNGNVTVFEQGDVENIARLDNLLQKAGGKPAECELSDMNTPGSGKAKPEFLVVFDNKPNTIIVIECKKSVSSHESEKRNKPKRFSVDGVLYYAKFLKKEYNVIVVAVSGTKKEKWKVSTFDWRKGQSLPVELSKGKDVLYSPENYLRLVSGEAVQKKISIVEIQELALEMDDLFAFRKGKRIRKEEMTDGNTLFVAAIDDNNGVRQRIDEQPRFEGQCISVNYNGSVGEAFYQSKPFCASDDVNVLYPKGWTFTRHLGLFLVTVIRANKYRFSYGRKWTLEKMQETILALPSATDGFPDWSFMENYIKSLPYSDRITD